MGYRFRTEGDLLVLQVYVPGKNEYYGGYRNEGEWRDATVKDIPINDPFNRVEYVQTPAPPPTPVFD
jgi:hypothetical protein